MIFQDALREFFGVEHVIPVGRAALGIYAALRAWSGGRKISVAVPAAICPDVVAAIKMAQCHLVFCDVDPLTGLVTEIEWRRAQEKGARAAIVVHLYGNPADTSVIRRIFAAPYNLVIDDAAQALGARTPTGLAGAEGDVGVVSFGYSKQIHVGGGAILFKDPGFARECESLLHGVRPVADNLADKVVSGYRARFDAARMQLVEHGISSGFANLLEGYEPALHVSWSDHWTTGIVDALANWPARMEARWEKVMHWQRTIDSTGLVPVGMRVESSPWRFACRLPGCDWKMQRALGGQLRAHGLDVSHWYLPAHWLERATIGSLPGAEKLASEAFQFWLDDQTEISAIVRAESVLLACFEEVRNLLAASPNRGAGKCDN